MIYQFVVSWIFLVNLIVFLFGDDKVFFFIGDPSLPFFDVGLDDFHPFNLTLHTHTYT